MDKKKSRLGWILGGSVALIFACFIFYLLDPRWFGERFIHFNGSIRQMRPLGDGRLLVVEDVQAGGGEDGPTTVGDRWRIVEIATGKILVGPYYVDSSRWATLLGDRFVLVTRRGELEVRDLHNALLGNLSAWNDVGTLRHQANDIRLSSDGVVTALSEDGRTYALDVHTWKATPVMQRGADAFERSIGSASPRALSFVGHPRAKVNDHGAEFLEPVWLADPETGEAIAAADCFVVLHYLRMSGSKDGRGPMLSAVNAKGDEVWRHKLAFEHLRAILVEKDQLIIGLDERDELGPAWLQTIHLNDGHDGWRLAL